MTKDKLLTIFEPQNLQLPCPLTIFITRGFFLCLKSALHSHRQNNNKVKPLDRPKWSPGQSMQKLSCSFSFVHSWTLNFKGFFFFNNFKRRSEKIESIVREAC